MGKGKAKGYRPPPPDDPSVGMLYGSADHLTGDTIASPVQLRQEGRAIPEGHPNFGDDFGKGGKGKGGKTPQLVLPRDPNAPRSATGANSIAVAPKAAPGEPAAKEEPTAGAASSGSMAPPPPLLKAAAKAAPKAAAPVASSGSSSPNAAKPTPSPSSPSAKAPDNGLSEIQRRRAAMTEIERRRAEMLEREKAAQQEQGLAADEPEDDPEARRLAVEARRKQAEARAREAEAKRRQAMAKGPESSAVACKVEEEDGNGAAAGEAEDVPMGVKEEDEGRGGEGDVEEEDEEDEVARAMARRRREEEEEENGEAGAEDDEDPAAKRPRADGAEGPAPAGGALKMGLQQWAERVNALAGDDPDLAQRCRDFVRRRILKAHADGNLHAVDWGEEEVPTVEALQAAGD